jgi:hypothetical protein
MRNSNASNGYRNRKISRQEIWPTKVVIDLDLMFPLPKTTSRENEQGRSFTILPKVTKPAGRYSL